jgi:hypothetical protein
VVAAAGIRRSPGKKAAGILTCPGEMAAIDCYLLVSTDSTAAAASSNNLKKTTFTGLLKAKEPGSVPKKIYFV